MSRGIWIPTALTIIGLALIIGGGMTFSRGGWGTMGPGYSGMCDSDEFHGAHVTDEPLSRGGAAPVFGPGTDRFYGDGVTGVIRVYTLNDDGR